MFTTDGRIVALDLKVLEDDRNFFPKYNVSLVLDRGRRQGVPADRRPDRAGDARSSPTRCCSQLNAQIDVEGREPADVAYEWLKKEGFVTDK